MKKGNTGKATEAGTQEPKLAKYTAADCRRFVRKHMRRGLVNEFRDLRLYGGQSSKEFRAMLDSGKYRRPELGEIRAELREEWGRDFEWWLSTIEAMQGSLAALRALAEIAESQSHTGVETFLEPHFDAIGAFLDKAHKTYSKSIRAIEKATA